MNLARKDLAYLARFDFDIHSFPELPISIRMRVLKEGKCLLSKDDDALMILHIKQCRNLKISS